MWRGSGGLRENDRRVEKSNVGEAQLEAVRLMVASEMCRAGEQALCVSDIESAREHARQGEQVDPKLPRLLELKAMLALKSGKPIEAMGILESGGARSSRGTTTTCRKASPCAGSVSRPITPIPT